VREFLADSPGKFGVVRVEEQWRRAAGAVADDQFLTRTAMAGDHVLVQLREGRTQADLEKMLRRHGLRLRSVLAVPRGFLVAADAADAVDAGTVPDLIRLLADEPAVGIVEPDYVYTISETRPDDVRYADLWGMEKIGMPRVWSSATGTGGVVVAVFDTGMDLTHPDLAANLWINPFEIAGNGNDDDGNFYTDDISGWDFYDNDNDPSDQHGHGTHVAGTVGAVGNNGVGVAGVGWNIKLLPIKFFGYNSSGQLEGYSSDAASGIYYIIDLAWRGVPIRVANHSWGGTSESLTLKDAFRAAGQYGILHVAAAGNVVNGDVSKRDNDIYPHYPASFDLSNVVSVANTTADDGLSGSSYYGAVSVDLGAPGEGILSTIRGGGYGYMSGTSMASPHVAGALALLFDVFPERTWQEARGLLLTGVKPLAALAGRCTTGGRLDVYRMLSLIQPEIRHEPLPNSDMENTAIRVDAHIRPGVSFVDTNLVHVLWNTTGSTSAFSTNLMTHTGANRFEAWLPGSPQGTTIFYLIRVATHDGVVVTHPEAAALHRFEITFPVALSVYGLPGSYGEVLPPYGTGSAALGSMVDASAPAFTEPVDGRRWRCRGWDGAGSVPFTGSTNRVLFEIRAVSYLVWQWCEQLALTQESDPPGVIHTTSWTDAGHATSTLPAPEVVEIGGVSYAFTGWEIDGARFPGDTGVALNPAAPLANDVPRKAVARYLPAAQDSDGDGVPDWWESLYFNHLSYDGSDDPDGDGFSNAAEFADRADPTDGLSVPEGPAILHDPLPETVGMPSPWLIEATITDRVGVAAAVLHWRRNAESWNEQGMAGDAGRYVAEIPAPDELGDRFAYRIGAVDAAGNSSLSPTYAFTVSYPVLGYAPGAASLATSMRGTAVLRVTVTNGGNADLLWQTTNALHESVAAKPAGWTHGGPASQWHISTREAYSAPYAWFCGAEQGTGYNNFMDASLYTPPVLLGGNARLRFMHWAEMEYDGRPGFENYYWDGAVVEISRDGGLSFESIEPVGGYPYRITPNDESPFAYHRPCLGGLTGGWEMVEFDLAAYAGDGVQVRFRFGSDGYVTSRGWFVDDISFSWDSPWLVAPPGGRVAAGTSAVVELRLEAGDLAPGTYRGAWTVACNAPGSIRFGVPLTFQIGAETTMRLDSEDAGQFVLIWATQPGRTYHLHSGTGLTADAWAGIPGFTNLPGVSGSMAYTGTIEALPKKFYRILETQP
jgi:subtilisin family serine protease